MTRKDHPFKRVIFFVETGLFVCFLSVLFLFSVIIGAALFGLSGQSAHLAYVNGQVAE